MSEREAVATYGSARVNEMLFEMDPDLEIHNTDTDLMETEGEDILDTYGGEFLLD